MDLIICLLRSRANWARAQAHLRPEALGRKLAPIVKTITAMYEADPSLMALDPDNVRVAFFKDRTGMKLSEIDAYDALFGRFATEAVGKSYDELLETLILSEGFAEIGSAAAAGMSKPTVAGLDTITELVDKYVDVLGAAAPAVAGAAVPAEPEVFITSGNVSVPTAARAGGFRFPIMELDRAAGPLDKGDFVWIAARMEMGKTTLMAKCVGHWAASTIERDRPILWLNNEERSDKIMRRIIQSYFSLTGADLIADFETARAGFEMDVPSTRLLITKQGEHGSVREVEALCEKYNPCLIIGDQWDKIRGFGKAERDDIRLGLLAEWGRGKLAAKYGPVIAVSQLDFLAEGARFPGMANLRGSKVDKAAEADLIITMGANDRADKTRGFSFEKNKLDGADEAYRHDKFELIIDPVRAQFYSPSSSHKTGFPVGRGTPL